MLVDCPPKTLIGLTREYHACMSRTKRSVCGDGRLGSSIGIIWFSGYLWVLDFCRGVWNLGLLITFIIFWILYFFEFTDTKILNQYSKALIVADTVRVFGNRTYLVLFITVSPYFHPKQRDVNLDGFVAHFESNSEDQGRVLHKYNSVLYGVSVRLPERLIQWVSKKRCFLEL